MYEPYFQMKDAPFRITPDTRHFYQGAQRGEILSGLMYAIERGEGMLKVVGEVGSGKTMLCRALETKLPESIHTVYIANPNISPEGLLKAILSDLNQHDALDDKWELINALQTELVNRHANAKQVVLFIEEAQTMPPETMEEIRLLANLETQTHKLVQIVLFGQPELDQRLQQYDMRPLRDRITHDFVLNAIKQEDCLAYLNYRTRVSGYQGIDLFSPDVSNLILKYSNGLLRRVNLLADKTLMACYAQNAQRPTRQHVGQAVRDSHFGRLDSPRVNASRTGYFVLILLALLSFAFIVFFLSGFRPVTF